jgi:hypothetical protein
LPDNFITMSFSCVNRQFRNVTSDGFVLQSNVQFLNIFIIRTEFCYLSILSQSKSAYPESFIRFYPHQSQTNHSPISSAEDAQHAYRHTGLEGGKTNPASHRTAPSYSQMHIGHIMQCNTVN